MPSRGGVQLTSLECGPACHWHLTDRMQKQYHWELWSYVRKIHIDPSQFPWESCSVESQSPWKQSNYPKITLLGRPCISGLVKLSAASQESPQRYQPYEWYHLRCARPVHSSSENKCLNSIKPHGKELPSSSQIHGLQNVWIIIKWLLFQAAMFWGSFSFGNR
jgi:hypothetical protein